ncbi:type II toxin-antitoxin system RelE/ParE family toxin [Muricoccus nepalensis]|nr:type II toxin-antitoxin system RelE/ParE family toxin [Roseomonas nepalensis]
MSNIVNLNINALDRICVSAHIAHMPWHVTFHPEMAEDFETFSREVRIALAATLRLLEASGPTLGRPTVDTLKGSKVANLKELRFAADGGVWRVAFAFDGQRVAVLLAGGDKAGVSEARFYRTLIAKAEQRWRTWE